MQGSKVARGRLEEDKCLDPRTLDDVLAEVQKGKTGKIHRSRNSLGSLQTNVVVHKIERGELRKIHSRGKCQRSGGFNMV